MARIRTIKPEFWKNELLGEMPPEFCLLFIGLWNLADRRGFLEDRPKRIKAELFPYRHVDIENGLQLLCNGFITRLLIDDIPYIKILNFEKHQHLHVKESESTVPAPYWQDANTVQSPGKHPISRLDSWIDGELDSLIDGVVGGVKKSSPDCIPPPPFSEVVSSNNSMLSYEDTKKEFLSSDVWHDKICMDLNLEKSFLLSDMNAFLLKLNNQDQFPRKLSDSKSYYYRSLVKFLKSKSSSNSLDYELGKKKRK